MNLLKCNSNSHLSHLPRSSPFPLICYSSSNAEFYLIIATVYFTQIQDACASLICEQLESPYFNAWSHRSLWHLTVQLQIFPNEKVQEHLIFLRPAEVGWSLLVLSDLVYLECSGFAQALAFLMLLPSKTALIGFVDACVRVSVCLRVCGGLLHRYGQCEQMKPGVSCGSWRRRDCSLGDLRKPCCGVCSVTTVLLRARVKVHLHAIHTQTNKICFI